MGFEGIFPSLSWVVRLSAIVATSPFLVSLTDLSYAEDRTTGRESIIELIDHLGHTSFRVRAEATRSLCSCETDDLDLIVAATKNEDSEISCRATRILSKLIENSPRAWDSFVRLIDSNQPVSEVATELTKNSKIWNGVQSRLYSQLQSDPKVQQLIDFEKLIALAERIPKKCEREFCNQKLILCIEFCTLKCRLKERHPTLFDGRSLETLSQVDQKKFATLLINLARLEMGEGQLAAARKKAIAAQLIKVTYGLFEDNPELLLEDLDNYELNLLNHHIGSNP